MITSYPGKLVGSHHTWKIIPVSKYSGSSPFISHEKAIAVRGLPDNGS